MMTMSLKIIGASGVDFTADDGTNYNYIKLSALVDNKGGFGSISQVFKYDKPSSELEKEFSFMDQNQVYDADCKGLFESNGKTATFIIKELKFRNNNNVAQK